MRLAVVVPTAAADRSPARDCLAALHATTQGLDVGIHPVVDSGPGFRFARSINRGMDMEPDADAWALVNDDAILQAGWVEALTVAARSRPDVGIFGVVLAWRNGRLQHGGGVLLDRRWPVFKHYLRAAAPFYGARRALRPAASLHLPVHHPRLDAANRIDFVTGAAMVVTRRCRKAVGAFDEDYPFGFEDIDYCLRAREAGLAVALLTTMRGVHQQGSSRRSPGITAKAQASEIVFHGKWPPHRIAAALASAPGLSIGPGGGPA